jgi:hypothetical protein
MLSSSIRTKPPGRGVHALLDPDFDEDDGFLLRACEDIRRTGSLPTRLFYGEPESERVAIAPPVQPEPIPVVEPAWDHDAHVRARHNHHWQQIDRLSLEERRREIEKADQRRLYRECMDRLGRVPDRLKRFLTLIEDEIA